MRLLLTASLLAALFSAAGLRAQTPHSTRVEEPTQLQRRGRGSYPYREKSGYILRELDLKPGDVVVDIGAGDGWWSERLARPVGPSGRIHAAEVDRKKVAGMQRRFENLPQVKPYLCRTDGTGLAKNSCDLAFMSQVYHHLDSRVAYLRKLREVVKPTGRFCLIERYPDLAPRRGRHGTELSRLVGEAEQAGWILVRYELMPRTDHYLAIFVQKSLFLPGRANTQRASTQRGGPRRRPPRHKIPSHKIIVRAATTRPGLRPRSASAHTSTD